MFRNFFVLIGGIALSLFDFFKNLSLDNFKFEKSDPEDLNSSIFSKLNLNIDVEPIKKKDGRLDEIRDLLLPYLLSKQFIIILSVLTVLISFLTSIEISAMYLVIVFMTYVFVIHYPDMKEKRNYSDLNQELPYALRHMGIELKSGKGLHDAILTIRNADYGSLSREFTRVLEEIKFGRSTEDSLLEMSHRVKSEGLSRAIHQIIGTLRVGGNLANSLEIIAQDISFDMQIKLKEYSQKLNSFILIYTFLVILAPVISLIMLMAGSTVIGDVVSSELLFVIYGIFFPLIVVFMGLFIKKLEPQI